MTMIRETGVRQCEIVYVESAKGWKWRALDADGEPEGKLCGGTFELFYDCVSAARKKGYEPNIKCP